jgi:hypothetical protein
VKEKFGLSSASQDCSGVSGEGVSAAASSLGERRIFLFFEEDVLATSCKRSSWRLGECRWANKEKKNLVKLPVVLR